LPNEPSNQVVQSEDETSEKMLVQELEPFIKPNSRQQVERVVTTVMQKFHSGPLPAPEDLEHYGRIVDRGAERIFDMTEREQAHRHLIERRVVRSEFGIRFIGQFGAIAIVALLAALTAYCASIGEPLVAAVIVAIGGVAGAFLKYSAQRVDQPPPAVKQQPKRKRK
jgi:uncharacterized membrane protein